MVQKILVLDDEENYAEMIQALLEQRRFIVDSVTRPEAALEALQQEGHELVISDFKMPIMDGSSFLQQARKINPDLPVILVSGLMNTPELVKVANMGVTLVLEKPIDINVLIENVTRFVQPLSEEDFNAYMNRSSGEPDEGQEEEKEITLSYPKNLKYLSDRSYESKLFLQSLWEAVEEGGDICVTVSPGAELELVVREVSQWKNEASGLIHLFPASKIGSPEFEQMLKSNNTDTKASNVIGITGLASLDEPHQQTMLNFVGDPSSVLSAAEDNTFIYFVEEALIASEGHAYDNDLYNVFVDNAIRLLPLNERLADLAGYVNRYLLLFAQKENLIEKASIAPDAIPLLLDYGWPGNFRELLDVIHHVVCLGNANAITQDELKAILKRSGATVNSTINSARLEDFLLTKQKAFLQKQLQACNGDVDALYMSLNLAKEPDEEVDVNALGLLYPELLSAE